MVLLNVNITNFRLNASAPATLSNATTLNVWSSTRRVCGIESPSPNPSPIRHPTELVFPSSWSLSWTERLPDRLAQRAAALHITAHSAPKSKLWFKQCTPRRTFKLGELRLDFLTLSTSTVCHSHALKDPSSGDPTPYVLSFDIIVEQVTRVALTFTDLSIVASGVQTPDQLCIEHVGGRRVEAPLKIGSKDNELIVDGSIPELSIHASSLRRLAHGMLRIKLRTENNSVAQLPLDIHDIWAAIAHPGHRASLQLQLATDIHLCIRVQSNRTAPTGQMSGGVTTDSGITGARPIIFGAVLPDIPFGTQAHDLPPGWITLVDTFGYRYYHHVAASVNVWTVPDDENVGNAIQYDEVRALHHGYERGRYGLFHNRADGTEKWIHPEAARMSMPSYSVPDSAASLPSPIDLELNSFSTLDMSTTSLHPAAFTSITRVAPLEQTPEMPDLAPRENIVAPPVSKGRIVEMAWKQYPSRKYAPGAETEGHTLTSVNRGKTLLKFAGSTGSGSTRQNTIQSYDVDTSRWSEINASGVLPAVRTGHGAVAIGQDQSQLLIFGGSSPQGRLNDLHMFHVGTQTWSPVSYTGTAPAPRARLGMTVTSDGATALVFGGRSIYRYLGGKYYDPLFVNAFHAERSQWIQMRPQGTGPLPEPRSGCVLEFINNRHMFLHGGYDDGDKYFEDTYLFDMVSSSWQKLDRNPDLDPRPRESHMSALLDGNVVIYGGDSRNGLLSDLNIFDSASMRWVESPGLSGLSPGKVCGGGMASIGDSSLLLVGGDFGFKMSRSVYRLDVCRRSTIDAKSMKELARERGPDAESCVVCLDAPVDTMFLWCGHSVCCRSCSKLVRKVCPVCRQTFSEIVYNPFDV